MTPWTVACQAPLSMAFFRQEYWNGLSFPSPGYLPNPRIEPKSPATSALQADSLLLSHRGSPGDSIIAWNFIRCSWYHFRTSQSYIGRETFLLSYTRRSCFWHWNAFRVAFRVTACFKEHAVLVGEWVWGCIWRVDGFALSIPSFLFFSSASSYWTRSSP